MKNKKIIIYGMGRIFKNRFKQFELANIIAITDSNVNNRLNKCYSIPVIKPKEIINLVYDFVVICTGYKIAKEIFLKLIDELMIPVNKILSEKKYFGNISFEPCSILDICEDFGIHSIYDNADYFNKHGILSNTNVMGVEFPNISWNVKSSGQSVLLPTSHQGVSLEKVTDKLNEYRDLYSFIIMPYIDIEDKELTTLLIDGYHIHKIIGLDIKLLMYEKREDTNIYVITHKNFNVPTNKIYTTLWVGKQKQCNISCLYENGENISELNERINECTGIYWVWKHSLAEIVGVIHYRRYFCGETIDEIITEREVRALLERYDIVVARANKTYPKTNSEYLRDSIDGSAFLNAYELIENEISDKQPDYIEFFYKMMNGYAFFPCNMFITRREIFNKYCEWLFSIILPAANLFDPLPYDDYSKRAIGFLAERLLTVWLYKHDYKIKEVPVLFRDTVCDK